MASVAYREGKGRVGEQERRATVQIKTTHIREYTEPLELNSQKNEHEQTHRTLTNRDTLRNSFFFLLLFFLF